MSNSLNNPELVLPELSHHCVCLGGTSLIRVDPEHAGAGRGELNTELTGQRAGSENHATRNLKRTSFIRQKKVKIAKDLLNTTSLLCLSTPTSMRDAK